MEYSDFLQKKVQEGANHGFKPLFMPDSLFDFQKAMARTILRRIEQRIITVK